MWVYSYICSMVKDRVRTMNHPSFAHICARIYMARNYGADVRNRNANDTLAYEKEKRANH